MRGCYGGKSILFYPCPAQHGCGLVLFLYSVMLTATPPRIAAQMDRAENSLMGAYGYCTQELVNLLITGEAASNVFDGERALGEGEEVMVRPTAITREPQQSRARHVGITRWRSGAGAQRAEPALCNRAPLPRRVASGVARLGAHPSG